MSKGWGHILMDFGDIGDVQRDTGTRAPASYAV